MPDLSEDLLTVDERLLEFDLSRDDPDELSGLLMARGQILQELCNSRRDPAVLAILKAAITRGAQLSERFQTARTRLSGEMQRIQRFAAQQNVPIAARASPTEVDHLELRG